ncbi:uncharacterized protein LOC141914105 [Tubulanus polymorphus]|uniref:uncharacterized protein LOC141914105 n=1 Tax=Tubulanus polymorphus TaxID=672921 RepID=UPI003DA66C8E
MTTVLKSIWLKNETMVIWRNTMKRFSMTADDELARLLLIRIHNKTSFEELDFLVAAVKDDTAFSELPCSKASSHKFLVPNILDEGAVDQDGSEQSTTPPLAGGNESTDGDVDKTMADIQRKIVHLVRMKKTEDNDDQDVLANDDDNITGEENNDDNSVERQRKIYHCDICGKFSTTRRRRLSEHVNDEHGGVTKRPFKCVVCWKLFKRRYHLNRHVKIHEKNKRLYDAEMKLNATAGHTQQQDAIEETVIGEKNGEFSEAASDTEKASATNECGGLDSTSVADHPSIDVKSSERVAIRPYVCWLCRESFFSQSDLSRHRKSDHSGIKAFRCELCQRAFARRYHLQRHLLTHQRNSCRRVRRRSKRKAYDTCASDEEGDENDGSPGGKSNRLSQDGPHTVHQSDEPMRANQRGEELVMEYPTELQLNPHQDQYIAEQPLDGGSMQHENQNRAKHRPLDGESTHPSPDRDTSVTPADDSVYRCYSCGKGFKSTTSMQKHLKLHTSMGTFLCDYCGKPFFQKGNMLKHITKIHNR